MQKNIGLLLISLVFIVAILVTGCTSSGSNPAAVTTPGPTATTAVVTTAATITTTATTAAYMAPTTVPTAVITTTQTPANTGLGITLNSAVKKTKIGTFNPKPGIIFLVLDITLKNNDINKDFQYTGSSFSIYDKQNQNTVPLVTNLAAGGLDSAFTSGMIPVKSEKTGQIVFGVPENSQSYKFSVYDSKGTEITSFDTINVS